MGVNGDITCLTRSEITMLTVMGVGRGGRGDLAPHEF